MARPPRIPFDFEGSLLLARDLWAFATFLKEGSKGLNQNAETVRKTWNGRFAEEFDTRIEMQIESAQSLAAHLEIAAKDWAIKWKEAVYAQNVADRSATVEEVKAQRSNLEKFHNVFVGDDSESLVPPAKTVAVPQPPHFLVTQDLSACSLTK